ncbi:MAG: glutamine--fructose-6-phosphate aminotransferase, partial [Ignavibacteriales bacterium]|nr:glutamine--fructose-6-phosphate aminotransferase [Ignavibacteriales bacterium]
MCGIVGYIGPKDSLPIVLEGLRRMEYRGYDSAGVAVVHGGTIHIRKKSGKVAELETIIRTEDGLPPANVGMGHTRWATHGEPNDVNAHPHWDCGKHIAVIHNGIIENFRALKTKLVRDGHVFTSETDTEVLAHLIEHFYARTGSVFSAVKLALNDVEGTYGLVVASTHEPDRLIAARMGSPLIIGVG